MHARLHMHMHTHTRTNEHTRAHAHAHAHAHTRTRARTQSRTHICTPNSRPTPLPSDEGDLSARHPQARPVCTGRGTPRARPSRAYRHSDLRHQLNDPRCPDVGGLPTLPGKRGVGVPHTLATTPTPTPTPLGPAPAMLRTTPTQARLSCEAFPSPSTGPGPTRATRPNSPGAVPTIKSAGAHRPPHARTPRHLP